MSLTQPTALEKVHPGNNSSRKARLKLNLLSKLYQEGQLSIYELCTSVKMSAPTVTKAVEELIKQKLVIRTGTGDSSGGRRPGLYSLNPSSRYVMAIDLDRSFIRIGIFDFSNKLISKIHEFNEGLDTLPGVIEFLNEKVEELLAANKISKSKVLGIGVSLPGLIDIHTGLSYTYLTDSKPVAETLTELTGIKTYIEHDTKVMALGEQSFGLAKGLQNVLCLNIGSGIGLSMILNGSVYKGHSGYSGEFGHIQIDNDGELCHCGRTGCIETKAAGKSVIAIARKQLTAGRQSILTQVLAANDEKLTTTDIIDAALQHDELAIELFEKAGEALGRGLAVLIHLFNPELIILGGELSKAGNFIIHPIERNLIEHTIDRIRQDASIVVSDLGDDAKIMGALALVMNKVLTPKNN